MTTKTRVPNRLAKEKSPYLLQHANNPVDWFPWGDEAFTKAKAEDKPIFLSIGYSTCHWCHVMERESFEDEEVAPILNESYISIKVDREERPDIDNFYMNICQAMTGQGGWPLTVIMTPEKNSFFTGTYFPKHSRYGMPGLMDILQQVRERWREDPETLIETGRDILESIKENNMTARDGELQYEVLDKAYDVLMKSFDKRYGGFGSAPKFPSPHNFFFLLRYGKVKGHQEAGVAIEATAVVEKTLEHMYKGGIFDHVGFGFSRYSTDKKWLAPHFEKMLYDNALLAMAYLEAFQVTQNVLFKDVAGKIFSYVLQDMTSPEGGFYSAEDADSEGVEGKFYLWTPEEIREVLGREKGDIYCEVYDISEKGNFEGKNIPNLIDQDLKAKLFIENNKLLEVCRERLFEAREKRVHPYKDDKVLTSWNALMIAALAMGARILDNSEYLLAAEKAVAFIFGKLQRDDGRLLARYRDGEAAYLAYLDDYAFLVWGLIELYKATYRPFYLEKALELNSQMLTLFWDKENGGLFMTGEDAEKLPIRTKDVHDGAIPSGNSVAAQNLLYLAELTGNIELEEKAQQLFRAFGREIVDYPVGYSFFLQAYLYSQVARQEVVIVEGQSPNESEKMLTFLKQEFLPYTVSLYVSPETADITKTVPFVLEYQPVNDQAAAYVCENKACQAPVTKAAEFRKMLT